MFLEWETSAVPLQHNGVTIFRLRLLFVTYEISLIASYFSENIITPILKLTNLSVLTNTSNILPPPTTHTHTHFYCLRMLYVILCMEDRWTVSPAIISYLPKRHMFTGQQIELSWSHRQEKSWDRPAAGVCVPCQELLYSDERLQPHFANEHFGKANRWIQHQHFLITVVSCGILCWRKRGKTINQAKERLWEAGK